jgi:uncharacterized protein
MEEKLVIETDICKINALLTIPETCENTGKLPLVIMCHGFRAHILRKNHTNISNCLASKGVASLMFDFFGHGSSSGEFEDLTPEKALQNLKYVFEFVMVNKKFDFVDKSRIVVYGSSFGGMVTLMFASSCDNLKFIVLKAPVSQFNDFWKSKQNIDEWKENGFIMHKNKNNEGLRLNYGFYENGVNFNVQEMAENIKCGVYIVHGNNDCVVPVEQSKKLIGHLNVNEKELKVVEGADHLFRNEQHNKELVLWIVDKITEKI